MWPTARLAALENTKKISFSCWELGHSCAAHNAVTVATTISRLILKYVPCKCVAKVLALLLLQLAAIIQHFMHNFRRDTSFVFQSAKTKNAALETYGLQATPPALLWELYTATFYIARQYNLE
jgi:hypothetical protein